MKIQVTQRRVLRTAAVAVIASVALIGGTSIVLVMPKKYPKRPMGRRPMGGGRRPGGSGPSGFRMGGDRESRPAVPSRREGEAAPPKPVIKRKESSEEQISSEEEAKKKPIKEKIEEIKMRSE